MSRKVKEALPASRTPEPRQIEAGIAPRDITASWDEDVHAFARVRQQYLIY